ncbi:MAG TPA: hypothetical protein ENI53_00895 [Thermoplasmatales archaeon]|nr:hypothetical protein [Thermoplasmatales archaeon]
MTDLQVALILLGFAIFFFTIIGAGRKAKKRKKYSIAYMLGIALIVFGIYEFPIGVMELYKITEDAMHLSIWENYLLWTFISFMCIVFGIVLLRRKK